MRRMGGHDLDRGGDLVWPVATYEHGENGGCSVTGGLVYGGGRLPGLSRRYVYGDYCAGTLWSLRGAPKGRAAMTRAASCISRRASRTPRNGVSTNAAAPDFAASPMVTG